MVYYTVDELPGVVVVPVGAFAEPAFPEPTISVYEERMLRWVGLPAAIEHMRDAAGAATPFRQDQRLHDSGRHMPAKRSVTPGVLQDRLASLTRELSGRDDALALLALGSVGTETDRLDAWSDLDFFVIVRNGAKGRYIGNLDWLAAAHPVVWHFQNTVDGHKALMADGVFCEFAVFEIHELSRIPYAPGRFVWRRNEVDESLACAKWPLPAKQTSGWLIGEALSNLIVGLQRHARGEKLAAMRMIQVHSLDRVLGFLELGQAGSHDPCAARDPFNVDRRIEMRSSQVALALPLWAGGYERTVPAALALLAALEAHNVVPAEVSEHIRMLATMATAACHEDLTLRSSSPLNEASMHPATALPSAMATPSERPRSVDEYISQFEPPINAILQRVRAAVREGAPSATEVISYRMPALRQNGVLVYFAAFKNHIGFYPPITGDAKLEARAAVYAGEKGNLRFPYTEPIPYKLITALTRLRAKQDRQRQKGKVRA